MKLIATGIIAATVFLSVASCNGDTSKGRSTPIDSSNVNGAAPADYSGANPAAKVDSNVNDTGTKANNVHNTGY